jgi:hypothetical protein
MQTVTIDTWSEEFKHQCLVRHAIKVRIKDRNEGYAFLRRWQEKHPTSTLEQDVKKQWRLGNRGVHMDWRTEDVE